MEGGIKREIEKKKRERRSSRETRGGRGEAQCTQGPASWALLSCLCTPQLADIILAALLGGVSGEVSTVTRKGPLSLSVSLCLSASLHPSLSGCVGTPPSTSPSLKFLNHRFTMFHSTWRRPGSHCARFHGHWEASCVMWLKVSRPWAELPSFQWEAK